MSNDFTKPSEYDKRKKLAQETVMNLIDGYGSEFDLVIEPVEFNLKEPNIIKPEKGSDYLSVGGLNAKTEVTLEFYEHNYILTYVVEHTTKTPLRPFIHEDEKLKEYLSQPLETRILEATLRTTSENNPIADDLFKLIDLVIIGGLDKLVKRCVDSVYESHKYKLPEESKNVFSNTFMNALNEETRNKFYSAVLNNPEFKTVYP